MEKSEKNNKSDNKKVADGEPISYPNTNIITKNKDIKYNIIKSTKIDIVYLWVTENDKNWRKKFKKHTNIIIDEERYKEYKELEFSLISVHYFLSWINAIYIITDDQKPNLKNIPKETKNKIKIIDHKEIIPKEYLPTFNSEVIQAFICNIKELSDNIIICDDDVFFGNYINICDIIDYRYNIPKTYWLHKIYDESFFEKNKEEPGYIQTNNTIKLIKKKLGFYPNIQNLHVPIILSKKSLYLTHIIFKKELQKTFKYKTRQKDQYKYFYLTA